MILTSLALEDSQPVGTGQAGAVDDHSVGLGAEVQQVGGIVVGDEEDTPKEEDVGDGDHSLEQEDKVQMTLWLLID